MYQGRLERAGGGVQPAQGNGSGPVLGLHDVVKVYGSGNTQVRALKGISLTLGQGRIVIIRGRSGAGKTTLLNLIGGLDDPTSGTVLVLGRNLAQLDERQRTELRRHELGFIFQAAHLDPVLSALENVQVPLRLAHMDRAAREQRSRQALAFVGLEGRTQHRAAELSGGEQQRVSIARALVHAPRLVLADEPTGNLDSHTGLAILEFIRDVAHNAGISFVVTTHDPQAAAIADAVYDINDGILTPARA